MTTAKVETKAMIKTHRIRICVVGTSSELGKPVDILVDSLGLFLEFIHNHIYWHVRTLDGCAPTHHSCEYGTPENWLNALTQNMLKGVYKRACRKLPSPFDRPADFIITVDFAKKLVQYTCPTPLRFKLDKAFEASKGGKEGKDAR